MAYPKRIRRREENILQRHFCHWLDGKGLLYTASLAGVNLHPAVGRQRKRMGHKAGVPDVIIFQPNKIYHGLCIELKVNNYPTKTQLYWQAELNKRGYKALIMPALKDFSECFNWLRDEVDKYLNETPAKNK